MAQTGSSKAYRTGLTIVELLRMFPDDEAARPWFEKERWQGEPWCPYYHKMAPKHLDRYVHEFSGRYNIRPVDTLNQMGMVVRGFERKSLPYAVLKARREQPSIS